MRLDNAHCLFTSGEDVAANALWERLEATGTPLGKIAFVNFGKQLRDRKKYTTDVIKVPGRAG